MKFYYDVDRRLILLEPGTLKEPPYLQLKRGDGRRIVVQLLRDGVPWLPPSTTQLRLVVKRKGIYAATEVMALASDWTRDTARKEFVARIGLNVDGLNRLLSVGADDGENAFTDPDLLRCELAWRESSNVTWADASNALPFSLQNNLFRGTEVVPGGEPPEEGTITPSARPLIKSLGADLAPFNSTLPSNCWLADLDLDLEAGQLVEFEYLIYWTATASSIGLRWWLDGPAYERLNYLAQWSRNNDGSNVPRLWVLNGTTYGVDEDVSSGVGSGNYHLGGTASIVGRIKTQAAGTLRLATVLSALGSGGSLTIRAGSRLRYTVLELP